MRFLYISFASKVMPFNCMNIFPYFIAFFQRWNYGHMFSITSQNLFTLIVSLLDMMTLLFWIYNVKSVFITGNQKFSLELWVIYCTYCQHIVKLLDMLLWWLMIVSLSCVCWVLCGQVANLPSVVSDHLNISRGN